MDLTEKNKKAIDDMDYESLLRHWRFAPVGDPWFQGETGKYWGQRMAKIREKIGPEAIRVSKKLEWHVPNDTE